MRGGGVVNGRGGFPGKSHLEDHQLVQPKSSSGGQAFPPLQ